LANRSVVLCQRTKIKKKWAYCKVAEVISKLACGEYYLSWYDGKRKRLDPAGSDLKAAFEKKRLELAYVATGGEVKQPDNKKSLELAYVAAGGEIKQNEDHPVSNGQKRPVSNAVKDYLADCNDRQGKSGYGLAVRTPETYEYRCGLDTRAWK
jgi:hypothetical protein